MNNTVEAAQPAPIVVEVVHEDIKSVPPPQPGFEAPDVTYAMYNQLVETINKLSKDTKGRLSDDLVRLDNLEIQLKLLS